MSKIYATAQDFIDRELTILGETEHRVGRGRMRYAPIPEPDRSWVINQFWHREPLRGAHRAKFHQRIKPQLLAALDGVEGINT